MRARSVCVGTALRSKPLINTLVNVFALQLHPVRSCTSREERHGGGKPHKGENRSRRLRNNLERDGFAHDDELVYLGGGSRPASASEAKLSQTRSSSASALSADAAQPTYLNQKIAPTC